MSEPKQEWPASKVEMKSVDSLIELETNARIHSDEQVEKIMESIRQFG